tara:strand:- start:73 stop:1152 length:1080 start_codon:yes stop_codon:yes gene_type:complete
MINLNEILAYKEIKNKNILKKKISFNSLINLSKKCNGKIYDDLKIYMILTIKWHFDYLAKTRRNPNELNSSIRFWFNILSIFKNLEKLGWINIPNKKKTKLEVWKNTRKAFNFMWPRNTDKKKYYSSKVMVDLRVNQFIKMISNDKNFFKDKKILDAGCGPGRYMESLNRFNPKEIIGIDSGGDIISANKKRFKKYKNMKFFKSRFDKLSFKNDSIDLLVSAGVLHHTKTSLSSMIKDHARVIKKEGFFFCFIVGSGGQELNLWKFCRRVMNTISIKEVFNKLNISISPLRLQGILDHSYGEYKTISRKSFEKILKKSFSIIKKVEGISGADVTPKTFSNDRYFKIRFGSGNLRYLCIK